MRDSLKKLVVYAFIVFLLFSCFPSVTAFAQSEESTYDETHPENLTQDDLKAETAILIEQDSGTVIFEKNADSRMYPASTTKVLTVLLGIEYGNLESTVILDSISADIPSDSSVIPLEIGETINFEDLLYATIIRSGNEGANLIATTISGNISSFVDLMNQTAQEMGCTGTHFANANGLFDETHYTTARDLSIIARNAMQNDLFKDIADTFTYSLPSSNLNRTRVLLGTSTNWLNASEDNEYYYPYATGIKTGSLSAAGYCYIGSAEKDGVKLISVVLNSTSTGRWTDSKKLMEYGFSQFTSVTPQELFDMNPTTIQTTGYSMEDEQIGQLELQIIPSEGARTITITATQTELEDLARNLKEQVVIDYTRSNFAAPITQGEEFGTLTYYPSDGGSPVLYSLVASRSIEKRENAPKSIEEIEAETYADPNPFPPISIEFIIILLIPVLVIVLVISRFAKRDSTKTRTGKKYKIPKPKNRYFS